ncbi:MAG: hypothetical protein CMC08_06320 [Flavobacteriaceae bacterium]|nr:hypothetical protein [Flavobacteriaceae bacterium]
MRTFALLALAALTLVSCKDVDEDIPLRTLNFTQNWDGEPFSQADLATTAFVNENNDTLDISRLRYLISKVRLENSKGTVFQLDDYQLVDVSNENSLTVTPSAYIPNGTYTMTFVYGFDQQDNIDGAYPDLNSVGWSWPDMLGGGYHFMQMDGTYDLDAAIPKPYNFHNGTARVSNGVFEANHISFSIPEVRVRGRGIIEIQMNIAEWFRMPYTWVLDDYNTSLMPNYEAQKLMNENGASVFAVVTE